jgi:hypothetical protein
VDVHRIPQIPLHLQALDDFVACNYTHSGTFSVNSAYPRELEHQNGTRLTRPDGQGNSVLNPIWKNCWSKHIPGKIKHFVWKVLRGSLPCLGMLAGQHTPCIPQCPICKIGIEDIQHCLFTCCRANDVWKELGLQDIIQRAVVQDRSRSITMEILSKNEPGSGEVPIPELVTLLGKGL